MKLKKFDTTDYINSPLFVATGSSWRRILHECGSPAVQPTNASDGQPDLIADMSLLGLMAKSPQLLESNIELLDLVKKLLSGKVAKCADETVNRAEILLNSELEN
jgi:hypothetical protein